MGTYVYALNTKVRNISGHTVGVAEFRYKPSYSLGSDSEKLNTRWYNTLCKRRVTHFENNLSNCPAFFVLAKLQEGSPVYEFDESFICFADSNVFKLVGHLRKEGIRWTIVFTEEYLNQNTI